jgi:nucleotide-binding universal stress UspA family protein
MTGSQTARPLSVLVGVDGSPGADTALDLVATAVWPPGSRVVVARAITVPASISAVPGSHLAFVDVADIEADLRAAAQQTVDAGVARVRAGGLHAEGRVLTGRAATALAEEAMAIGADLIVVGSRGHGTIETMVLGSVSAELVDHARTPVLVARGASVSRAVLAWDGSMGARTAGCLVGSWPMFAQSSVRIVTVTDVGPPWWSGLPQPSAPGLAPIYLEAERVARERNRELADGMAQDLRRAGLRAEAELRDGDPAGELIASAAASRADVIVIGTHGRTGLARVVLGSVARKVLTHAPCSVLVVRDATVSAAPATVASAEGRHEPVGSGAGRDSYSTPWGDWP